MLVSSTQSGGLVVVFTGTLWFLENLETRNCPSKQQLKDEGVKKDSGGYEEEAASISGIHILSLAFPTKYN